MPIVADPPMKLMVITRMTDWPPERIVQLPSRLIDQLFESIVAADWYWRTSSAMQEQTVPPEERNVPGEEGA